MIDLACSAAMLALSVLLVGSYAVRFAMHGAAHFERVNQAGSSVLLGKPLMEMTYWGIQPLAQMCMAMKISANAITVISLATSLCAAVALSAGHFGIASVFMLASFLCDALDGIVARETGTASEAGEVLDAVVDRYVEFFLIGSLIVFYRNNALALGLALLALLGSFMISYGSAKGEAIDVLVPRGSMRRAERAVYLGLGTALTSFVPLWPYPLNLPSWFQEPPLLFALALIGTVGNISAVLRVRAVMLATDRFKSPASSEALSPIVVASPVQPDRADEILWNRAV